MTALPARGEVWWCELAEIGRRPVVVLSRDAAIPRLRRTLIGPCDERMRQICEALEIAVACES
jgi:mRNA interferase MazF